MQLSGSLDLRKDLVPLSPSLCVHCASQLGRDGLSPSASLLGGGGGDTIKRKQAEGLAVFSCFNSELSAVGTTLSEQDKGDKMKTLPTSPLPVSPEFSIKGMAERESML